MFIRKHGQFLKRRKKGALLMVRFLVQQSTLITRAWVLVFTFRCIIDGLICGKIVVSLGQIEPTDKPSMRPVENKCIFLVIVGL